MLKIITTIALCAIITASIWQCASIPTHPPTHYSTAFVKALCEIRAIENIPTDKPIKLVRTTRPVVDMFSLRLLYDEDSINASSITQDERESEQLIDKFKPRRIVLPETNPPCGIGLTTDTMEKLYSSDHLVFEVSNPVPNRFTEEVSTGVFVRFSLGGFNNASWYWLSPVPTTVDSSVTVHPLAITEM